MRTSTNRKARLGELRTRLIAEQARIATDRQGQLEPLLSPEKTAVEDQAPLLHDQFVAITNHGQARRRIAAIESALARFERGEFGLCEACGEEIPLKRLEAVPWALRCVPCQDHAEQTGQTEVQRLLLTAHA